MKVLEIKAETLLFCTLSQSHEITDGVYINDLKKFVTILSTILQSKGIEIKAQYPHFDENGDMDFAGGSRFNYSNRVYRFNSTLLHAANEKIRQKRIEEKLSELTVSLSEYLSLEQSENVVATALKIYKEHHETKRRQSMIAKLQEEGGELAPCISELRTNIEKIVGNYLDQGTKEVFINETIANLMNKIENEKTKCEESQSLK